MTARTERLVDSQLIGVTLPAKFAPAEARVIEAMRRHQPRANDAELRDTIYLHGLILLHDALNAGVRLAHPETPR